MDVHTLRVHQASVMLWRKGSKPSFAHLNNKVWVPFKVLPVVTISFPPPLPVSDEIDSPPDDVQLNHKGVPHLYPRKILGYRNSERRWYSFPFLCFLDYSSLQVYDREFGSYAFVTVWFFRFCSGSSCGLPSMQKNKTPYLHPLPLNSKKRI
jgi:hypothetical protein